ncbi:4'-phosphopantetheinyl transferase family protein [Xanthobacteraceae bacterium A53D]
MPDSAAPRTTADRAFPAGEIHIYQVDDRVLAAAPEFADYRALLSEPERARAQRFHFERHRNQQSVTRVLVRTVLSLYAPQVPAQAWEFTATAHGRPLIAGDAGRWLHFNVSHTEGRVVLAVGGMSMLGIDVEVRNTSTRCLELAAHFFAPEEASALRLLDAASQRDRFFDLWTLKEAYIKARGLGLSLPLRDFIIGFTGGDTLSLHLRDQPSPSDWHLWSLPAGPTHSLALACHHKAPIRLRVFEGTPWSGFSEMPCPVARQSHSAG